MGLPGGSVVRNLPTKKETRVRSLGQEDPLEKGMATHSSILVWSQKCLVGYSPCCHKRVGHNLATKQQQQQHGL